MSLIPKSIEDKGKTLTLGDVKWSESMDVDGEGRDRKSTRLNSSH